VPARRRRGDQENQVIPVADYEHPLARRTNNPPVGLVHLDRDETPVRTLSYDPHLDPQLIWSASVSELKSPSPRRRSTCMKSCQPRRSSASCDGSGRSSRSVNQIPFQIATVRPRASARPHQFSGSADLRPGCAGVEIFL